MAIVPLPVADRNMMIGIDRVFKYLSDRGIRTPEERDLLQIRIVTAEDIGKRDDNRAAIVFTHFDIAGHPIDWWCARLIDTQPSFASLAPRGKTYCPPKEPPAAYLVPSVATPHHLDWTNIPEGSPIFIHESCIKAYAGARAGYYSIGLNGVWGWGSSKHEIALLRQIKDLPWAAKKLKCIVVFDSNVDTNDDVHAALAKFAERMGYICKVEVQHLPLPKPPEEFGKGDWGFDDYCVFYGDSAGEQFLDTWETDAQPAALSELELMKLELNRRVAIVRNISCIVEQDTGVVMRKAAFTDVNYAHFTASVTDGEKIIQVSVPKMWLKDPKHTSVFEMNYVPGADKIQDDVYNLWRPSGVEPLEGDVSRWLKLMEFSLPDENIRKWLIQWLAYPLQNPGKKMDSFVFIYGYSGTGKQAILYPILRIYGKANAITVGKENLESSFNSIYAQRQFVVFDEMNKGKHSDPEATYNKLKKLTTLATLTVNTKGVPEYDITNCLNFAVIANYPNALKIDDGDRRCCVIEFGSRERTLGKPWFTDYHEWIDDRGASEVYDYLLKVDLSDFNPHGDAPMTEIKKVAITAGKRADEQWISTLWEDPDQVLPTAAGARALFTSDELASMCYAEDAGQVSMGLKKTFGVSMHAAGFRRLPLKIAKKVVWFYVVRKRDREWTSDEMRQHLKKMQFPGV